MFEKLKPYRKAVMAVLAAAAIAAWPVYQAAVGDGALSGADWRAIAIAAGGAVLVWLAPNKPAPVLAPLRSRDVLPPR